VLGSLALTALIGASCSTVPAATDTGTAGGTSSRKAATNLRKEVQFAQCMRSNGVSNFPDPDASGQLTIEAVMNGSGVNTNSSVYTQAFSACRRLEPAGFTGSTRSPLQQEAALRFAQCVRANGVSDFPDPTPSSPLIDTTRIPSSATPNGMSILNTATHKCESFLAAAGVTGHR
jgi:hypothetical protein